MMCSAKGEDMDRLIEAIPEAHFHFLKAAGAEELPDRGKHFERILFQIC